MTRSWKLLGLTLVVALLVAGVAAFWLWSDYTQEKETHEQVLISRGEAVLAALEGGIRTHRRLGNWFPANINVVLEETASASGIQGLGIFKDDGELYVHGGTFPDSLHPSDRPQWVTGGLLICQKTKLEDRGGPPMGGGRRRGWGREAADASQTAQSSQVEELFRNPVWLSVLLDGTDYREAMAKARGRFAASLTITLLAIGLGILAISLIQRQGRMAAELGFAHEQEKRLEELALLGAGLAHETKNPLGLIRGMAQSLLRRAGTSDDQAERDARRIVDEADRVVSRINAFLTYARPKPPEPREVDLAQVAEEVAGLFRDETAAKRVDLETRAESPLPIQADPDQLRQVLVNLVANALAACSKGHRIEIAAARDGDAGFALTVRDTGEGIAEEDIPNLTKPYFTRRQGGTGLGLAIVHQIAEAHGWRLEIHSRPGQGSAFTLRR